MWEGFERQQLLSVILKAELRRKRENTGNRIGYSNQTKLSSSTYGINEENLQIVQPS